MGIKLWTSRAQFWLLVVVTLVLVGYPTVNGFLGLDVVTVLAWVRQRLTG